jgi:hypothetical protein
MRRQLAAWIAVLGLIAAGCTSSAEAGDDLPSVPVARSTTPDEASASRLVENFFRSLQQRDAHALYALFEQDGECRPPDIEQRLVGVQTSIADTSEIEADNITLRQVGVTTELTFDLIERQGTSEKLIPFEQFFPVNTLGTRWKFAANVCEWLTGPDVEVQNQLRMAESTLEEFRLDTGTYLATPNDLRYYASGLKVIDDEMALTPGTVLLTPGAAEALVVGQGTAGTWYCIALTGDGSLYGSSPNFEDVALWEGCAQLGSTGGW